MGAARGFTLIETVLAVALAIAVIGVFINSALEARRVVELQAATVDVEQRARAVLAAIAADIASAGSSVGHGPPLGHRLPVVWPRWIGPLAADAEGSAFADRVATLSATGRVVATLVMPTAGGAAPLDYMPTPHCPASEPTCGFVVQAPALVWDLRGRFDLFRVADAVVGRVVPAAGLWHSYAPADGAQVAAAEVSQYAFDAARRQIRWSSGISAPVPVVDDVVAFGVEYFSDTRAPREPRPPPGAANCLYDASGLHLHASSVAAPGLVPLTLNDLSDGPFCGEAPTRFDVDLLRVRLVRVRVRVQASSAALRGRSARFTNPGSARGAATVPDFEWSVDVIPAKGY